MPPTRWFNIAIYQPVSNSRMWESHYTHLSKDSRGQMMPQISTRGRARFNGALYVHIEKKRAYRETGQTRGCCTGLQSACWGPRSPRLTLLLFAAVDGKFYKARLSFTTNPNEWRPERRGKRKKKDGRFRQQNDLDRIYEWQARKNTPSRQWISP